MKKFIATILASIMCVFGTISLTGCSELTDVLDLAFENEVLLNENALLKSEIAELETENATLKFYNVYPTGVIGGDDIVELNKVKLEVGDKDGDALVVEGSAQVTINGGHYNGGTTPFGGAGNTSVWVRSADAKVVINDGYFYIDGLAEGDDGHIELIYCKQGTVEINGGYFKGADSSVWLLNCLDEHYTDGTAKIIVKGGTFVNFDPSNCISEGENTSFVADGYTVVKDTVNGTDYYKVVKIEVEDTESVVV